MVDELQPLKTLIAACVRRPNRGLVTQFQILFLLLSLFDHLDLHLVDLLCQPADGVADVDVVHGTSLSRVQQVILLRKLLGLFIGHLTLPWRLVRNVTLVGYRLVTYGLVESSHFPQTSP